MKRILVLGAGGAAANGFCRALKLAGGYHLIGANCDPYGLELAETDEKHLLPRAGKAGYETELLGLVERTRPDLCHAQPDEEVLALSTLRDRVPVLLPSHRAVRICQNKWWSYCLWKNEVPQPETFLVVFKGDLDMAFDRLGEVWLRQIRGAGGAGSIRTRDRVLAERWVDHHQGWSQFTAAEVLTPKTATWTSLWHDGKLVVAQGRRRVNWAYSRNTPSGVSGMTGVGETFTDPSLSDISERAVRTIDDTPHGLYGVDCAMDTHGVWNPTEINVGRFHTTVSEFFARCGLNIPDAYCRLGTGGEPPELPAVRDGLRWVRTMDKCPRLM